MMPTPTTPHAPPTALAEALLAAVWPTTQRALAALDRRGRATVQEIATDLNIAPMEAQLALCAAVAADYATMRTDPATGAQTFIFGCL